MSKMSTYEVILTSTPDGATWYGDQRRCHTDERVHVTATTLVEAITVAESMNPGARRWSKSVVSSHRRKPPGNDFARRWTTSGAPNRFSRMFECYEERIHDCQDGTC